MLREIVENKVNESAGELDGVAIIVETSLGEVRIGNINDYESGIEIDAGYEYRVGDEESLIKGFGDDFDTIVNAQAAFEDEFNNTSKYAKRVQRAMDDCKSELEKIFYDFKDEASDIMRNIELED